MDSETIAKLGALVVLIPLLIAFGEFLKYQGIEPKIAGVCTLALGFVIAAAYTVAKAWPAITADVFLSAIVNGFVVGLSACGFYSITAAHGVGYPGNDAYVRRINQQAYRPRYTDDPPV